MKKTRRLATIFLANLFLLLSACSAPQDPAATDEHCVAPYPLTEQDETLLRSFGLDGSSQILTFQAPTEATVLHVQIYRLGDEQTWCSTDTGSIYLGTDRAPTDRLAGIFTMQLLDHYALVFHIDSNGLASYQTEGLSINMLPTLSATLFLEEAQPIELEQEIPVALMIYSSDNSIRVHTLQDYFNPSAFSNSELVQAVTLKFSAEVF